MSTPPGSQPGFSGALPRPPPIVLPQLGQAALGAGTAPPQGFPGSFPRPSGQLPGPPLLGNPLILNPPGAVKALPVVIQPKSTTLYVGRIAPTVGNDVIKQLLDACGPVREWKRMEDPETKALKPFGFCEYEEAEGVVRALNLLNNLAVGGQELLLKCNTQTTKYIESIEASKNQRAQSGQAADLDSESAAEDADNLALEKIMALVSANAPSLPPPPVPAAAAAAADSFLAGLKEEGEHARHAGRHRRREGRPSREEDVVHKEKDRERREAEARQQEQDNAYKAALRKWEAQENDRRKQHEREREHERDRVKERDRLLKADLDAGEADDEPWRRKLYAGSRRAADRKRRREKENEEDTLDRENEAKELAKKARSEERAMAEREAAAANGIDSSKSPATEAALSPRLEDMNDSITQAMMSAAKAPRKPSPSPAAAEEASTAPPAPLPAAPARREAAPPQRPAGKSKAVLAAFGGVEDEDAPKRTLRPISYTEEEQRAAAAVAQSPATPEDKAAAVQALIERVPTEMAAVAAYDIDWAAFDSGGTTLRDKIGKWVLKKTTELLGEEEASMVEFIMSQLQEHVAANSLLEELQNVLDDEAKPFVLKLYRMVIFETLKQQAGLQD